MEVPGCSYHVCSFFDLKFGLPSRPTPCLPSWMAPSSILGSHSLFDFAFTEDPWEPQGQCWVLGKQHL